jgi:hypothetical protein
MEMARNFLYGHDAGTGSQAAREIARDAWAACCSRCRR